MGQVRRKLSERDAGELGEIEPLNLGLHPQQRGSCRGTGVILPRGREFPNSYTKAVSNGSTFLPRPSPQAGGSPGQVPGSQKAGKQKEPKSQACLEGEGAVGEGLGGQDKGAFY